MQAGSNFARKLIPDMHKDAFSGRWAGEHVFNIAYIAAEIEEANIAAFGIEAQEYTDELSDYDSAILGYIMT